MSTQLARTEAAPHGLEHFDGAAVTNLVCAPHPSLTDERGDHRGLPELPESAESAHLCVQEEQASYSSNRAPEAPEAEEAAHPVKELLVEGRRVREHLVDERKLPGLEKGLAQAYQEFRLPEVEGTEDRDREHGSGEGLKLGGCERLELLLQGIEAHTRWVASGEQPHRVHHARVVQLVKHEVVDELARRLLVVGLDAADEVGVRRLQRPHQVVELTRVFVSDEASTVAAATFAARDRIDRADREELREEWRRGR
mmetsp:Transcript_56337/g.125710  ORF Transcript_56337/g.125710 Transcript_56337/m.125710 type:complete len:255 (-) Transcript_56337:1862-2626(-)